MQSVLPAHSELASTTELEPRYIDSHAHIHFDEFAGEVDGVLHRAGEAGVTKLITVGVNTDDSRRAVELAAVYQNVWATVGIHPHEAAEIDQGIGYLRELAGRRKVVAIGECGLDFYRHRASASDQERALRMQVELARELGLPVVFHVRDAFERFLAIMADYPEVPGVVHSFTAGPTELEAVLARGWMVALNGIMTFTKDEEQLAAARRLPLDRLILETDCPFLSPAPHRGKTNEPARVPDIAVFLSRLRGEPLDHLAAATTANTERLFGL
jgi:TatD DNase family protein